MSKIVDEYSFNNPKNQGNGKWQRLMPLSTKDPLYSISKSSPLSISVIFCVYLDSFKTSVEKKFIKGWKHPDKKKPQLQAMYKILWSDMSLKPYNDYR